MAWACVRMRIAVPARVVVLVVVVCVGVWMVGKRLTMAAANRADPAPRSASRQKFQCSSRLRRSETARDVSAMSDGVHRNPPESGGLP